MKDPYSPEMLEKYYAKRKAAEEEGAIKGQTLKRKAQRSGFRGDPRLPLGEKVSKYEFLLEADGRERLVFKHAVAYVSKEAVLQGNA